MLWLFAFWDDLDADFRRFYRIDGIGDGDYGDLSGPRFLALAERCLAYDGALLKALQRIGREQQEREQETKAIADNSAKLAGLSDLFD